MQHYLCTVYDSKAGAYLPVFMLPSLGMATRTFGDCINDPGHNFGLHPADYSLFCLGTFDDNTGEILIANSSLGNGVDFIKAEVIPK